MVLAQEPDEALLCRADRAALKQHRLVAAWATRHRSNPDEAFLATEAKTCSRTTSGSPETKPIAWRTQTPARGLYVLCADRLDTQLSQACVLPGHDLEPAVELRNDLSS